VNQLIEKERQMFEEFKSSSPYLLPSRFSMIFDRALRDAFADAFGAPTSPRSAAPCGSQSE
jgi:hypothetical protein